MGPVARREIGVRWRNALALIAPYELPIIGPPMHYTTLGRTGLRVSVAGLGTGGFSRLGLKTGKSEEESARLLLEAVDLGVNFIDTAPS